MRCRLLLLCSLQAALLACSDGRQIEVDPGSGGARDAGSPSDGGSARCFPECSGAQVCVDGRCVLPDCEEGQTRCGALCIDTSSDVRHCGDCTTVCSSATGGSPVCSEGHCGVICTEDPQGTFCPNPMQCTSNHCCGAGQIWCTDRCASVLSDPENCGGCGQPCSAMSHGTAVCSGGRCMLTCSAPYEVCQGTCADKKTDPNHCGFCGHACGAGASCSNGSCVITATCTIAANLGWQACSGVSLIAGDMLDMSATGMWSTVSINGPVYTGPGGTNTNPSSGDYRYNTHYPYGALLWRVSSATDASGGFSGATLQDVAPMDGALQFRINDQDAPLILGNNTGSMSVTVKVARF